MPDPWSPPPEPIEEPGSGRTLAIIGSVLAVLVVAVGAFVFLGSDDGGMQLAFDADEMGERADTRGREQRQSEPSPADPVPPDDPEDRPDEPRTTAPTTTEPEDNCPTTGEILDRDALPPPDVGAAPLALGIDRAGRGTEYPFNFDGDNWPYLGELFVEVTPGTYTDVPVHLEPGEYAVIYAANDCIKGSVEIYLPSGELMGVSDDLGRPGVVEGWEFTDVDEITQAGTYTFRVIQDTGTEAGGFPLRFYAPAE